MTMRVLLFGASGQVGGALLPLLRTRAEVTAPSRREVDLADPDAVRACVRAAAPALIVNAAGYTAVDRAESEREPCRLVNAIAPAVMAEEGARLGAPLVHYSTNFVFDGALDRPYRETDVAHPLNWYGATKLEGEQGIATATGRHLMLRTALVFSRRGGFVGRILALAREREELTVVDDQFGSPTRASFLAAATLRALDGVLDGGEAPWGTYHLTSSGATSILGYAERVLALDPARGEQRVRRVVPVTSQALGAPARRPANGVLDCTRFAEAFGVRPPRWEEELAAELRG